MEQSKDQSEFSPWYLDADGNPLPMDRMMSALYPGSTRGAWVSELSKRTGRMEEALSREDTDIGAIYRRCL